ncbi:NAD(P)-binding protein [Dentipellis sp. KUC8613]|nr:NAD(P)-binding protein [Dentipellis sp. KUC8613]
MFAVQQGVLQTLLRRGFSTSLSLQANRAVVYSERGPPSSVLQVVSYPDLPPTSPGSVSLRVLLSPVNPSDINVIEGVYPLKPNPVSLPSVTGAVYVGGNEGLAEVKEIGKGVEGLQVGDWVVPVKPQSGTWNSALHMQAHDVVKVPKCQGLSPTNAATLTVNPPTAYNMLKDYVDLQPGDWVVQNGANSAVGQAVIQIAANVYGARTINLVRNREDIEELKQELTNLGATHVLTYDDLLDKDTKNKVKKWTGSKDIRLGLNCVSGKPTTLMARLLGKDAHLVSYGAMSKQPLLLPTSLFIFKNLTCHGFWQSRWYSEHSREEREELMSKLVRLMTTGQVRCY